MHLSDYPPTSKMSDEYFGTGDDDSNPEEGKYFKTANNLPWAVNTPQSWEYPREQKQITWAYLKFAPWAESGGDSYLDWYDAEKSGYVDEENIYEH